MIRLDFFIAIATCVSIIIIFMLVEWIIGCKNNTMKDMSLDTKFIFQCPICGFLYHDYKSSNIASCPRCGSFSKREEAKV